MGTFATPSVPVREWESQAMASDSPDRAPAIFKSRTLYNKRPATRAISAYKIDVLPEKMCENL